MTSLISVIVPVYKVEKYVRKCIDSIICQTYSNLEIILVDDGSPDNCPKICDSYAEKDPRIKVIHKKNAGLGFARNSGLEICAGDFVMFVDSDDYLSLDCVEVLYERIVKDNSDIVIGKYIEIFENGQTNDKYCSWYTDCVLSRDEVLEGFGSHKAIAVVAWAKLYKRQIIKNISYPSLKCGEDAWVLQDIIRQCEKISLTGKSVYYYLQHSDSIIHSLDDKRRLDNLNASLRLIHYLVQENQIKSASFFYYYSIECALSVSKSHDRLKYFKEYLDKKTRRTLLKEMNFKTKIKWYGLFIPYANRIRKLIVKIKKNIFR